MLFWGTKWVNRVYYCSLNVIIGANETEGSFHQVDTKCCKIYEVALLAISALG